MKLTCATVAFVALLVSGAAPALAQAPDTRTLELSFDAAGAVTLKARNVTVRDILAEWARKCGCFIVNADRLTGSPLAIPVWFENAPQASVLESLLRQAAGYVLTPRRAGSTSPSNYEVIYILATSTAISSPLSASYSSPALQPVAVPIATVGAPDDEIPPVLPQRTENKPAAPPPPPTRSISPGISIVPIVPIGPPPNAPVPGTSTPPPPPARPGN